VKPDVQKERRELPIQGAAGPGVPIKPDKKANVALSYEEVRKETVTGVEMVVIRNDRPGSSNSTAPKQTMEYSAGIGPSDSTSTITRLISVYSSSNHFTTMNCFTI